MMEIVSLIGESQVNGEFVVVTNRDIYDTDKEYRAVVKCNENEFVVKCFFIDIHVFEKSLNFPSLIAEIKLIRKDVQHIIRISEEDIKFPLVVYFFYFSKEIQDRFQDDFFITGEENRLKEKHTLKLMGQHNVLDNFM